MTSEGVKASDLITSIRTRPGMYVGDTGTLGLSHLVSFGLDVLCAAPEMRGARVSVIAEGRSIRIEASRPPQRWSELKVVLDSPMSWDANPWNGPWELLAVLTLSSSFSLDVKEQEARVRWEGSCGKISRATPREDVPCALVFEPDETIFAAGVNFDPNWLVKRAGELAVVIPGLETEVSVAATGRAAVFCYPLGVADLVAERGGVSNVPTWHSTRRLGDVHVDAAVQFPAFAGRPLEWISFANTVPTTRGGSHVRGLEEALRRAGGGQAATFRERALGAISVHAPRDQIAFEGPIKNLLKIPWLEREIADEFEPSLRLHLQTIGWFRDR